MRNLTTAETALVFGGQDGPGIGYDGGPVPDGHTDIDGTGRFSRDPQGEIHMTPGYAAYLNANSSRIDWNGVAADLTQIGGGAIGFMPVGQLASWVAWGFVGLAELAKKSREAQEQAQRESHVDD